MILGIATGNISKYNHMKSLLKPVGISSFKMITPRAEIKESNNGLKNAISKSSSLASKVNYPILASDEELYLNFLSGDLQPGSEIKRHLGETPGDEEIYNYYFDLLSKYDDKSRTGAFVINYAISYKNFPTICLISRMSVEFRIPCTKKLSKGRPLASFHFVPTFQKFYSELEPQEKYEFNKPFGVELSYFITTCLDVYSNDL